MPEPSESKMDIGTGDRGGDEYRVAKDLKKGGFPRPASNEAGVPKREMPRFAADEFYQFRTPDTAYENGGKDGGLPDGVHSDGSQPRHMRDEDNKFFREK